MQSAAENEAWQVVACGDVRQFVRHIFRLKTPLTVVDLPQLDAAGYAELCEATARAVEVSDALLVVCGTGENPAEEIWARQLGVWAYLPKATASEGLELVFREARKALAQQVTAYVDSCGTSQGSPPVGERPPGASHNLEQQNK